MSQHNISRKDFLQLVGLGVSAQLAEHINETGRKKSTHTFSDPAGRRRRPLWVQTVEQPTVDIRWDSIQRFNAQKAILGLGENSGLRSYIGDERVNLYREKYQKLKRSRMKSGKPGFSLKDQVLRAAHRIELNKNISVLGPEVPTPEDRGVDHWEGSPDEAARTVRIAMRMFGAAQVGFVRLNEENKKLIYSVDRDGKKIQFEDVNYAYETPEKRVIPTQAKWVIVYSVRMSIENMKYAPSIISDQESSSSYARGRYIQRRTQAFLKGLGYQGIGQVPLDGLGLTVPFSILAGLGEMSRLNRVITPEFGPMIRPFILLTDLPLATDKPIDAGIMEFCKTCKKCSESCPAGALSPEIEPTWHVEGPWNNSGHRAYFEDSVKCISYMYNEAGCFCSICFAVCPFSKKDMAWIHSLAKGTISLAPQFNGFFRSMDDALSYGAQRNFKKWWHSNLPEYGLDS